MAWGRAAKKLAVSQHLGVDEKAISKGHRYMTPVCDLEQGAVEYAEEDGTQASLGAYFEAFTPEQLEGVQAVSMDMWEPYIKATSAAVPGAKDKIVFDRFHIMQQVLRALDRVHRAENKDLRAESDDALVRTKYLWLRS